MTTEETVGQTLINAGLKVSTAESCTGGLLSSKLTDVSGSSAYVSLNLVTYSNDMKMKMLGVSEKTLKEHGAVSEQCAFEMARGLHELTGSDICISTTGIAGPTGGTKEKPVGLMYCCIYTPKKFIIHKITADSSLSRITLKNTFAESALEYLYKFLGEEKYK